MCYITQDIEVVGTRPLAAPTSTAHALPSKPAPLTFRARRSSLSSSMPLKKRARRVKKAVKFSLAHNKINTRPASPEDLQRAWHTREEYKTIQESARDTLLAAAITIKLTNQEPADFTARGLESHLSEQVRNQRKKWIETTVGGVLLVQALQKQTGGVVNAELLKAMSEKGSETARVGATMLGALDAEHAKLLR